MELDSLTPRLDGDGSHAVFRALLDAVANPGRVTVLDLAGHGELPPVMLPALALADIEVSFHVVAERSERADELAGVLTRATGARRVADVREADLVVAPGSLSTGMLRSVRTGSAEQPELGARVFAACGSMSAHGRDVVTPADDPRPLDEVVLGIVGPGAARGRIVRVRGLDEAVFDELHDVNSGYPAGLDVWLVADDGSMVGIPRSCRLELVAESA